MPIDSMEVINRQQTFTPLTGGEYPLVYMGEWDASTNDLGLSSSVGMKGACYKVSVNGATNLDGISSWKVGDYVTFNGMVWDKLSGPALNAVVAAESIAGFIVKGDANGMLVPAEAGTDFLQPGVEMDLTQGVNLPINDGTTGTLPVSRGGTGVDTITGMVKGNAQNALAAASPGSDYVKSTLETAQATTSGTSKEFTGIPSWVKKITIALSGVSTSGTSHKQIQLGTSGGYVTSGYNGGHFYRNTTTAYYAAITTGFGIYTEASDNVVNATMRLTLVNAASNIWQADLVGMDAGVAILMSSGYVQLSGALDRVKLTTVNGTDTFDAGGWNILYE